MQTSCPNIFQIFLNLMIYHKRNFLRCCQLGGLLLKKRFQGSSNVNVRPKYHSARLWVASCWCRPLPGHRRSVERWGAGASGLLLRPSLTCWSLYKQVWKHALLYLPVVSLKLQMPQSRKRPWISLVPLNISHGYFVFCLLTSSPRTDVQRKNVYWCNLWPS